MTRNVTRIRKKPIAEYDIGFGILSAGVGNKIKSYEPRSLLKISGKSIVDTQIETVSGFFEHPEIIVVVGCHANKVIKKIRGKARIVENQIHNDSNSAESLRLAFNNSTADSFMFCHGDVVFNDQTLDVSYDKSFVITNSDGMIKDQEIGITKVNKKLSIMSYGLPCKWCQMAFFTGREKKILKNVFNSFDADKRKWLSFEIINKVVEAGGRFECYEPKKMRVLEVDRIKDIQ
tara:strand:+ start:433 stop:1131 length:699 start_codon:yes stop_codon:yes gene_type:complete